MVKKEGKLLTATDIAEYLNVTEHTIYRWCKSGRIPHFNLDSTYRFDSQEINNWLESKHQESRARRTGTEA